MASSGAIVTRMPAATTPTCLGSLRCPLHKMGWAQPAKHVVDGAACPLGQKRSRLPAPVPLSTQRSEAVLGLGRVGAAGVLDDDRGRVGPRLAAALHVLALHKSREEA